jgi:hypothetical protein
MDEHEARNAAMSLQLRGWDVRAQQSPLRGGWELAAKAADGGKDLYGLSHNDMKTLVLGGQVAKLPEERRYYVPLKDPAACLKDAVAALKNGDIRKLSAYIALYKTWNAGQDVRPEVTLSGDDVLLLLECAYRSL